MYAASAVWMARASTAQHAARIDLLLIERQVVARRVEERAADETDRGLVDDRLTHRRRPWRATARSCRPVRFADVLIKTLHRLLAF
jgi:hypothetical protein